jgi:PAS domain S-box-containing protein
MTAQNLEVYKRALEREKNARKAAEKILEDKSAELFKANQKLKHLLKAKTSELKGVFENIVDAYVMMDLFGNVLKMNDAAVELLGFDNSKQTFNLNQLVIPEEQDKVIDAFKMLLKNSSITNFKLNIITNKREEKLVHINANMIYNSKKEPIAAQGIIRDITEVSSLQNQKEELLKELKNSNEHLQEYAYIVSHDLKSPLRGIYSLVTWIKDDNLERLDKESLEHIELVQNKLDKMDKLITDILQYSVVSTTSNKKEEVSISSILKHVIQILHIPQHINVSIASDMPIVIGDRTKLQQLFQNLIGNAIKYNDKEHGRITVEVKVQEDHYHFIIQDNGIGIDEKYHKKIFEVFNYIQESKDSTGIGLSIVKKIVESHGGEIWVESVVGEGTTFHFTLKK